MKLLNTAIASALSAMSMSQHAFSEETLADAFSSGTVGGNIRAYYNTRDYQNRADESGFALGGALRAETGAIGISKLGVGYYTAQDMGLNPEDPLEVNRRLGDDLEVLAEAYLAFDFSATTVSIGRQKVSTPFANPSDAFMVPMTFSGYSAENTSISNLKFNFAYLNEFKNRNSDTFVDVGAWSTARYGVTPTNTSGTIALGATYSPGALKLQTWYYQFPDLFDLVYLQADYAFDLDSALKPFVGFQYGLQGDTGDQLLGDVESSVIGVKAGLGLSKAKFTLAYNSVPEEEGTFRDGAILAPFNYSTSPFYTNSMLQSVENNGPGDAIKLTFNYTFADNMPFKVSYATLEFENIPDRDEVDIDFTYKFSGYLKGFSIRNRLAIVTSDADPVEQTNNRFQLQYVY